MPFGKWGDFESCVRDLVSRGKDEETAKRVCGYLQARLGEESFSWVGDIGHQEKNLIRGKALHPIKTVHPNEWPGVRVYLEEELVKAARTLTGAPLLLDHLYPIKGEVLGAEYEDGVIEYVAKLDDVQVLNWIRDGAIRYCSVEYDWRSLDKVNGVAPRGIRFTGLALLKDFEPGDPGTTVEVWKQVAEALKEATGRTKSPEDEKTESRKRLGEGVVEPSVELSVPKGYVSKQEVLTELKTVVFERVPHHWGYGPYEQNRRIKELIKRLEE